MKRLLYYIFLIFLLVVYVYSIVFDFFPLSTKIILEAIGLIYCFKYLQREQYRIKKEYRTIFLLVSALVLWDIITSFINGGTEFHLIKDIAPIVGGVFAAQLIFEFADKNTRKPINFMHLVVFTIFAESVLTIIMKIYPPIYELLESVLVFDFGTNADIIDIFEKARFYGIGNAHYFGVLPSCAVGVMTTVYLLNFSKSMVSKYYMLFTWIVIGITSFFVARWTVTLLALSLGLFLLNQSGKNLLKAFGLLAGLLLIVFFTFKIVVNTADEELLNWALSSFVDSSSSEDRSAVKVMDSWREASFDLKTFIIGDAQYSDGRDGYYMHTDIGYLREIYYCGIIGLLLNLFAHVKILKMAYNYNKTRQFKFFLIFLFFSYLAILGKGDTNMMTFFILYLVFYTGGVFEYIPNKKRLVEQRFRKIEINKITSVENESNRLNH